MLKQNSKISSILAVLIIISSVLVVNSISIDEYIQKNYGVELNIPSLQIQRQVQYLVPPTDSVLATFSNSMGGGIFTLYLTCTPNSTNTTVCIGTNDGTNGQSFNSQLNNITTVTFFRTVSYFISNILVNTTTYESQPLDVNFSQLSISNINWSINPTPSFQFSNGFLLPNSSNYFTNSQLQIIGNMTVDKSSVVFQYIELVLPYYQLDLNQPEPTFGQNTIFPIFDVNITFVNYTNMRFSSIAPLNQSCFFEYLMPFNNPQPVNITINTSATYPNTDNAITYQSVINLTLSLDFSKYSYYNTEIALGKYSNFAYSFPDSALAPLLTNVTIYGVMAPDKSNLNITWISFAFNQTWAQPITYNFSYIPIAQQQITSANLSIARNLFEPFAFGQYIQPSQNYTMYTQNTDNSSWIQYINYNFSGQNAYYLKQSNLSKYDYFVGAPTYNLSISYNIVTSYIYANGTKNFTYAVNNSYLIPTPDIFVQAATAQNSIIYNPITKSFIGNVTFSIPLTPMFSTQTMFNFGYDNITITNFTLNNYYDHPDNLSGGQLFVIIGLLLIFLGGVFMVFYYLYAQGKQQNFQQLQNQSVSGRNLITNQLYDL